MKNLFQRAYDKNDTEETDHDLEDQQAVVRHSIPDAGFPVVTELLCLQVKDGVVMCN